LCSALNETYFNWLSRYIRYAASIPALKPANRHEGVST
jgi:hypothetical protein